MNCSPLSIFIISFSLEINLNIQIVGELHGFVEFVKRYRKKDGSLCFIPVTLTITFFPLNLPLSQSICC